MDTIVSFITNWLVPYFLWGLDWLQGVLLGVLDYVMGPICTALSIGATVPAFIISFFHALWQFVDMFIDPGVFVLGLSLLVSIWIMAIMIKMCVWIMDILIKLATVFTGIWGSLLKYAFGWFK